MKKIVEQLASIGLDADEAAAYVACLELRESTVLEIARKSGLNRSTLYSVIDRLLEKRLLVRTVAGKRTLFAVQPPQAIEQMLKDRLGTFSTLLPELVSLSRMGTRRPKIAYEETLDGIKAAYRASLESKEREIFAFVGVDRLNVRSKELQKFWDGEYREGREKNGIVGKVIVPDTAEGKAFRANDANGLRETRFVPASKFNFEGEILLFDSTVTFISYTEKETFVLTLESDAIAKTLRMIWQIAWASAY